MLAVILLLIIYCKGDILKGNTNELLKSWMKKETVNQIIPMHMLMQNNISTLEQLQSLSNCNRNQLQKIWKLASDSLYRHFLHSLTDETKSTEAASFTDFVSNEIIRKLEQERKQNISELNLLLEMNELHMYSFVLIENEKFIGELKIMDVDEIIDIIHNDSTCKMTSFGTEFNELRLRCLITELQNEANIQTTKDKYLEMENSTDSMNLDEQNIINKWRDEQYKMHNVTKILMRIIIHIEREYVKSMNNTIDLIINSMNDVRQYGTQLKKQLFLFFKILNDKEFYTHNDRITWLQKEDQNLYSKYSKYIDGSSLAHHLNTVCGYSLLPEIKLIHISRQNEMVNVVWEYRQFDTKRNHISSDICNRIKFFVNENKKKYSYKSKMQMVDELYVKCNNSISNYGDTLVINKVEIKYELSNPIRMTLSDKYSKDKSECKATQYDTCEDNECKLIQWSDWSTWSSCDRPCGGGKKQRDRTCVTGNELDCINELGGKSVQTRSCNKFKCTWKSWSDWSKCPVWCGGGFQYRFRKCRWDNAYCLAGQSSSISGTHSKQKCNTHSCFNVFCTFLGIFC